MAAPTRRDLRGLKRLGRYLRGNPRVVLRFPLQGEVAGERNPDCLYCPVDSNWVDCRETRRSTSGGALVHGKHTLATWSVTQAIQALSSGEAEYYALLRGAVEALGLAATAEELGFTIRWLPRLGSDSNAARGAAGRHGLGKLKHLELKFLWLQATLRQGRLVGAATRRGELRGLAHQAPYGGEAAAAPGARGLGAAGGKGRRRDATRRGSCSTAGCGGPS